MILLLLLHLKVSVCLFCFCPGSKLTFFLHYRMLTFTFLSSYIDLSLQTFETIKKHMAWCFIILNSH